MKKSTLLILGFMFLFACQKKKDGGNSGLPVTESFNPVGSWYLQATPATFNDTSCGGNIFGVYSDTVTISLNGAQTTLHGFDLDYKGDFSNNTLRVSITDFDPIFVSTLTDTYELGFQSDHQATGLETWNLRGDLECSGTHKIIATKN